MKHIETNFLIYDLAKNVKFKPNFTGFKFIFLSFVICAIFTLICLINYNLRLDLYTLISNPTVNIFYMQFVVFSISAVLGCYLSYKLSIPGLSESVKVKILHFIFYTLWFILFACMFGLSFYDGVAITDLNINLDCAEKTLLGLILPLVIILSHMKKGYVVYHKHAIVTSSLTAFSFASFINLFTCPQTEPTYILLSHNLIIIVIIILFLAIYKIINLKK